MTPSAVGSLRVLYVGTLDDGGGAASAARSLLHGVRARGLESWMAVGRKTSDDPHIVVLPDDNRTGYRLSGYAAVQRALGKWAGLHPQYGWGFLSRSLRLATHPGALTAQIAGAEDFEFPGSFDILNLMPRRPDVLHCHNLHGGFFDLRALSWLSHQVPTALTLHDSWLLTGHCAHSFDCDRWTNGCGSCPDLSIYPAIRRDATARNWTRKREIYGRSRLYVTTPSNWLMDRARQSMLWPSVALSRVIPNGVDLSTFKPGSRDEARRELGLPAANQIVLLMSGRHDAPWTDAHTLNGAVDIIAELNPSTMFIAVGDDTNRIVGRHAQVRTVPYERDPHRLAAYYRAADVYLHCARAATCPLSILEALACGTPVVAREVGGIREQVRSIDSPMPATGILVGQANPLLLARAVIALLDDGDLSRKLGEHAARDAQARFDRTAQVTAYLDWYGTIIDDWKTHVRVDRKPAPDCAARPVGLAVD